MNTLRTHGVAAVLLCVVTGTGCGAHVQEAVKVTAAEDMDCFSIANKSSRTRRAAKPKTGQIIPWMLGGNRYLAVGCGKQAIYVCLGDTCHRDSEILSSEGDEPALAALGISPSAVDSPPARASSPAPSPPAAPSQSDPAIRALLDANRDLIVACLDKVPVALEVAYSEEGSLAVSLRGDQKGSAEEQCVQSALQGLRVPSTGSKGRVIHVLK